VAIDSNGLVWQNWRGAHRILSFDRRKCKVRNGPDATGQQCPEGWAVNRKPGPTFHGGADYSSTDMLYMTETDRDGLGKDVVLAGDVNAHSFFVVMPARRSDDDVDVARSLSAGIGRSRGIRTDR